MNPFMLPVNDHTPTPQTGLIKTVKGDAAQLGDDIRMKVRHVNLLCACKVLIRNLPASKYIQQTLC